MRDPFKPHSNKQLIREAQVGFTVIGLLVATLIYVAWYRINGLDEVTPEHIRDSPVAMQVFPNSPNYDRETHTMRSPKRNSFTDAAPIATNSTLQPKETTPNSTPNSMLATVPKRIMADSNRTARSLQDAAASVEKTAAHVATLTSLPKSEKPFGLVSNPAANGESDSGFKVFKRPEPIAGVKEPSIKKSQFPIAKEPPVAKSIPASEQSSISSRFNAGSRFGSKPVVKTPVLSTPSDVDASKIEAKNQFKPIVAKPFTNLLPQPSQFQKTEPVKAEPAKIEPINLSPVELKPTIELPDNNSFKINPVESKPVPAKPLRTFGVPKKVVEPDAAIPRLPKLPEQSLNDLRSLESPAKPAVKTVSFEDTTWPVKKGDSFWSIAQTTYGDGRFFRALYEQNRRSVPGFENLTAGVTLELPTAEQLINRYPSLCPSDAVRKNDSWRETPDDVMDKLTDDCERDLDQRLYETKSGDTLFKVARRQLGQASRYVELIELNEFRIDSKVTHETELPSGIQLLLPKK